MRGVDRWGAANTKSLPAVGVASAWCDPENPAAWSGVPYRVVRELRRMGVYAGRRDVMPHHVALLGVYKWLKLSRRAHGAWTLAREVRHLSVMTDALHRWRTPSGIDGWVHLVGGYGRATAGRYVTLFDMSPAQLLRSTSAELDGFGYSGATSEQMRWVARRQVDVYRRAHACCVPSRWAADSLISDHGIPADRVFVVGYGNNVDLGPPDERDWSIPRFLFIGRDWARKNGDAVVRAFLRLREHRPDARLDVVGDHPPLDIEGVTGHGPIRGYEPDGKVQIERLLARATCFVLPSSVEPFGIVYVEAAKTGLASIATSVGGTSDSVGAGGIIVDPHDDNQILSAMRTLSDADSARELGLIAQKRADLFTWPKVAQRVYRALDLGPIPGVELAEFI